MQWIQFEFIWSVTKNKLLPCHLCRRFAQNVKSLLVLVTVTKEREEVCEQQLTVKYISQGCTRSASVDA